MKTRMLFSSLTATMRLKPTQLIYSFDCSSAAAMNKISVLHWCSKVMNISCIPRKYVCSFDLVALFVDSGGDTAFVSTIIIRIYHIHLQSYTQDASSDVPVKERIFCMLIHRSMMEEKVKQVKHKTEWKRLGTSVAESGDARADPAGDKKRDGTVDGTTSEERNLTGAGTAVSYQLF